jgi:hypothetical protein
MVRCINTGLNVKCIAGEMSALDPGIGYWNSLHLFTDSDAILIAIV